MAAAKPHTTYEFGGFRLDPQRQQLLDPAGVPVPLSSRAFDALVFLASHAGEVLDKSKLLRSIWPNAVVEENTLTQHISALRRALGDGRNGERFILTVAGRGYKFVAEVRQHTDPVSNGSRDSTSPMADVSGLTRARTASFAVLPFTNLSEDAAKEYFADGIAEELIHKLARLPGVRVSARTSSFAYKNRDMDVRKVARELEVTWVLEGSVRSAGERIRITVQLIDGTTGFHVWSQSYDRRFEDLFALQDEIANAIVAIHLNSPPGEIATEAPDQRRPTRDLQAYQLYLQGRALALRAGRDNLRLARGVLTEALARDPDFARAYAALAVVFLHEFTMGTAGAEAYSQAREMVLKALQLDADLPEAHATLGVITADRGEWLAAHEHFRVALSIDHRDGFIHHSLALSVLANTGHVSRALDH